MNRSVCRPLIAISSAVGVAVLAGAFAFAQESKPQEKKLPPGWTEADMAACTAAGTPGPSHAKLAKLIGLWIGNQQCWMAPGAEATTSSTTWSITSLMDGRYVKTEVKGDMPGMGPFSGAGVSGFDNVSQQFVADWVDNMSTGIMQGTGEISADGKTLTWRYTYNCPITKKSTVMREIQKLTSDSTMAVEFHCTDPKSGKEFKCMQTELKKSQS